MNKEIQANNCNELKTLKYKSMILNGVPWPENKSSSELASLDKFLENEKITNSVEPWSKLDKTAKIRKLAIFADNYRVVNNLTDTEYEQLMAFFRDCLDKKKLQRVKDVNYNKETGEIKDIPALLLANQITGARSFEQNSTWLRISIGTVAEMEKVVAVLKLGA